MAQELSLLDIDEVSLVDAPANSSVDPATGRKVPRARVALWKRDEGGNQINKEDQDLLNAVFNKADGKTYSGKSFPKGDFAYTPDDEPSHWKLRLTKTPGGDPDPGIVGAAAAALSAGGFRGNRVAIPSSDLPSVKAKVRAAWKKANSGKDESEMPDSIKKQGEPLMTLDELTAKVEKQDGLLATLTAENTFMKAEREVVVKMSKKERKAYASMSPDMQKEFMAGDAEKRKKMCDTAMAKLKEKAAEDSMDEAMKREYATAGPVRKGQMLAEALEKLEKAGGEGNGDVDEMGKKKKVKAKSGAKDNEDDDEDEDENEDLELRKRDVQIANLTDRVNKSQELLAQISKKETLEHFTKMAREKLPNTSGSDVEKGQQLMDIAEASGGENSTVFKSYFGNLVEADKALSVYYGEVGKAGQGVIPAEKLFNAKVEEIMKRDKITIGKATDKAMSEAPELYAAYEQDHRRVLGARA